MTDLGSPASRTPASGQDVFDQYARYYDLIYKEKDYAAESSFVHSCLSRHGGNSGQMLELGSGTGRHAMEFARLGWNVKGYDVSAGMVENANRRRQEAAADLRSRMQFEVGDLRTLRDPRTFDAVVSLFHVISYQTTNSDLGKAMATVSAHLKPGGLLFLDFWFGPAVLSDPPVTRIKRMQDERTSVTRLAEPQVDYLSNVVTVNYEVWVEDRGTKALARIEEQHRMRYLFLPEMDLFLHAQGLSILETGRWMDRQSVGKNTWYVWLLARKTP